MTNLSTKDDVIREFSEITGFTLRDSTDALNAFIKIFENGCRNLSDVNISGLGKLKHTIIKEHQGNRPVPGSHEKQPITILESVRTTFVLSKQLKNLSKNE
jgi:nucleoid DNA-binding protein